MDINSGWRNSRNMMAGGPTDLKLRSDTILKLWLGLTQPYITDLQSEDFLYSKFNRCIQVNT